MLDLCSALNGDGSSWRLGGMFRVAVNRTDLIVSPGSSRAGGFAFIDYRVRSGSLLDKVSIR